MSGHSKWSTIKRKKQANDQKRSGIFAKMSRLITVAVHEGGGIADPEKNFQLRLAIDRAKYANMPKDTIQRAIDKATGGEGALIKEIVYEGFGPHGVAMLIATTTDNSNRTVADLKNVVERNGGKMASQNAVSYLFTKCGVAEFDKSMMTESDMFAFTEAISALDAEETNDHYIIFIPFASIGHVKDLTSVIPTSIDIYFKPQTVVELTSEQHEQLDSLIEKIEDLDETQNVYTNAV